MDGIEPHSKTWRAVTAWAEERIRAAHADLEEPSFGAEATQVIRGRVQAYRELLALGAAPRPIPEISQDQWNRS